MNAVRLALCALVLGATCLGCANGMGRPRPSSEGIVVPFMFEDGKQAWQQGSNAGDQSQRITEFVRVGQSVENWTELVTWHTFNKTFPLDSVEDQMAAQQRDLGARCPGSTMKSLQEAPQGVVFESLVVNCPQGADEHVLGRVLDGTSNRFLVQYSVRSSLAMTPERRAEWIEKLMTVRIMNVP